MKICIVLSLLFISFYIEGQIHLDINTCRRMIFEQFQRVNPSGIDIHIPKNHNDELINFFRGESASGFSYMTPNDQKHSPIYWSKLGLEKKNIKYAETNSNSDIYLGSFPQITNVFSQQNENIFLDNPSEFYRENTAQVIEHITLYSQEIDFLRKQYSIYEKIVEVDVAYWELIYSKEMEILLQEYHNQILEEIKDSKNKNHSNDIQKLQVKLSNIEKVWNDVINQKLKATQNLCRILGFEITTSIAVDDSINSTFSTRITLLESVLLRRPEYNLYKKENYFQREVAYLQDTLKLTFNDIFSFYRNDNKLYKPEIEEELIWMAYNVYLHKPEYYYKNGRLEMHFDEHRTDSLNKQEIIKMINNEIEQASSNLKEAQRRVYITYNLRNEAQKNMELTRINWKKGNTVIERYLENRTTWYYSWEDWVSAKKELKICETYYLRALGKLLKDI